MTNQEYMEALQWAYYSGYVRATTSSVWDIQGGSSAELLDLDAGGCEIAFSDDVFSCDNPDHPVKQVTWYGAASYCDWLSLYAGHPRAYEHSGDWLCNGGDPYGAAGYRLPTDAEWEYAAQCDDERIYPWVGDTFDCDLANSASCVGWTLPVGSCPDGNSNLGFSDMAGNVWEWCNDWFECDLGQGTFPQGDPTGPQEGSSHVVRGGSWNFNPSYLRCASRYECALDFSGYDVGFRVARTVNP